MAEYEDFTVNIHHPSQEHTHVARFAQCVVNEAGIETTHENEFFGVWASFDQEGPIINVNLSKQKEDDTYVPFGHSTLCPALLINDPANAHMLPHISPTMNVRIATCVVLRHEDHLLLTRRAKTMRTFPRRWVFPGGHVDQGETLVQAAVREVKEEIGLSICNLSPIGIWESCFPTFLDQGTITRQHLVFYFMADLSPEHTAQFPAWEQMTPDIVETDCVTWVNINDLKSLLSRSEPEKTVDALKMFKGNTDTVERKIRKLRFSKFGPKPREEDIATIANEGMSLGSSFILQKAFVNHI